jgi:hypothetical protein
MLRVWKAGGLAAMDGVAHPGYLIQEIGPNKSTAFLFAKIESKLSGILRRAEE